MQFCALNKQENTIQDEAQMLQQSSYSNLGRQNGCSNACRRKSRRRKMKKTKKNIKNSNFVDSRSQHTHTHNVSVLLRRCCCSNLRSHRGGRCVCSLQSEESAALRKACMSQARTAPLFRVCCVDSGAQRSLCVEHFSLLFSLGLAHKLGLRELHLPRF